MSATPAVNETRNLILRLLGEIAPEADLTALQPDVSFRDQLDLDSMDFLNFVIGLGQRSGVKIPEADTPRLRTMRGLVAYLCA
jgi:acyl carrier protein